jgi:carboxy-terminal domain RNA polymerase II polypeptide A small phosphatase
MEEKSNKLLILDLDETLIYATKEKIAIPEDFRFDEYYVYKRPYLNQFLADISKHFTIGIWSSADDLYVEDIVSQINESKLNLEIIWGRTKCTLRRDYTFDRYYFEKRLKKLKKYGFSLEQILIVDDTPEKSRDNFGNAVYMKEYTGDTNDQELLYLYKYLLTLKNCENVRTIEKRGWRLK